MLRYGTCSQWMLQFYLHTPCSSANGMNHTCLCLPSWSWSSFTDPGGMEGWVAGWLHTKINIRHRKLNPDTVAHLSTNRARRRSIRFAIPTKHLMCRFLNKIALYNCSVCCLSTVRDGVARLKWSVKSVVHRDTKHAASPSGAQPRGIRGPWHTQPSSEWIFYGIKWLCWDVGPALFSKVTLWATTKKGRQVFFRKKVHPRSFCGPQYKILAMHLFTIWDRGRVGQQVLGEWGRPA